MHTISIRTVVAMIIAPLGLLLLLGSVSAVRQAYNSHVDAARVAVLAGVSENLFHSLAAARLERGSVLAGLINPAPIAAANLPRVTDNRAIAERALATAVAALATIDLPGLPSLLASQQERHTALTAWRQRGDAALRLPREGREAAVVTGVPAAFDSWMDSVTALVDAVDGALSTSDLTVNRLVGLKRATWSVRFYAGVEALRVNNAIASGRVFTPAATIEAAIERGRIEQGWMVLREAAARPDATAAFRASMADVERLYFGYANGAMRERINALSAGRLPEVALAEVQQANTVALGSLVELANTVLRELVAHAAQQRGAAAWQLGLHGAVALLSLGLTLAGLIIARVRIAGPIQHMTAAMRQLADRDLNTAIPGMGRGDEIGGMAAALQVFKDGLIESERLTAAERVAQEAARRRSATMEALTQGFEAKIAEMTSVLASSAGTLQRSAAAMTDTAGRGTEQAAAIGRSADNADSSVQTVAAATEELAASIAEITRQVGQSQTVVQAAVTAAEHTNEVVRALTDDAQRISQVVTLIQGIAGQTNLLALNATIEAARAGDAGKGFAVVAGEVKALAAQTAKATGEIGTQIGQIQAATNDAVAAIRGIAQTISQVSEITGSIAGAIQEQDAATREISSHVQRVAAGNREVAQSIGAIGGLADETGRAAADVLAASGQLSRQTDATREEVRRFLAGVKAA